MKIGLKLYLRLIITGVILVPATVILLVGGLSLSNFASDMMLEEVGVLSRTQISGFKNILSEYTYSLRSFSQMDIVRQTAAARYANVKDEIRTLITSAAENNPYILDVIITGNTGTVYADYIGRRDGSIFSGFNENVTSAPKNEAYISDIAMNSSDYGTDVIFIIHPVSDESDLVGYVAYAVSCDALHDYLSDTAFFETGNIFVADGKGTALNLGGNKITRLDEISNAGIAEVISSNRGKVLDAGTNSTGFEAGGYLGVYGGFSASDWTWYGVYPLADVSAMVSEPFMKGFMLVFIISAVCAVAMLFVTKYTIKPMNVVIQKLRNITAGNRDERFDTAGSTEYARMGVTFNEMIAEVSLSEELHRTISELSDNMLFEWDFNKEAMFVSDNFLNLFNVNPKACTLLNGRFIDSLMEGEFSEKYKRDINKILKCKSSLESEYKILTRNMGVIWISMRAHCITDRLGELLRIVGVITNINTEKKLSLQLAERASYDFLSQLYNRTTFERELQSELARTATSRVAVIFIDVDDFKNINDKYGHSTGDEIIKHTSKTIKDLIGKGGFAGRFGGDEFIMCITNEDLIDNIDKLANELIANLKVGYYSEQHDITLEIKASIGIALAPEHGKECGILIACADEAMYCVKKKGKNDYHIYAPDDSNLIDIMHSI